MRKVTRINHGIRIEPLEGRELMSATIETGASGLELTALQTNHLNNESSRLANDTGIFAADQALPTAKWDVKGSTTFSTTIDVGVVASAEGGIAEVDFQVNGGDWHQVTQTSVNPQTGATEYWVTLNASDFNNGQIKITAAVMPNQGQVKYLSPLTLTVNKDGTNNNNGNNTNNNNDNNTNNNNGNNTNNNGDNGQGTLAIANWDAVPHQTFAGELDLGVVAFHSSGISEVDFSINGGDWQAVTKATLNPQTGAVEYWIALNASDYADGAITIDARAIPTAGQTKNLSTITLYADSNGTLSNNTVYVSNSGSDSNAGDQADPFKTIQQALTAVGDGGTVILENAGTYDLGVIPNTQTLNENNQRWITIEAASGLSANQVTIIAPNDNRIITRVNYMKFEGITLDFSHIQGSLFGVNMWFDHDILTMSDLSNPNPAYPYRSMGGAGNDYATNSLATHTVYGFVAAQLDRNCEVSDITGDAYQNAQTIINCTVHDFYGSETHHADIYQTFGNLDNVVIYGLSAWNLDHVQGIFLQPTYRQTVSTKAMTNCAFVNINIVEDEVNGNSGTNRSQMMSTFKNILFLNYNTTEQEFWFRDDVDPGGTMQWNASDVVFEDCTFNPHQSLNPTASGVQFIGCTIGTPANPDWQAPDWLIAAAA